MLDPSIRWTDRLQSSSGEWSGNLCDFYFRVYNKLQKDIKIPFETRGGDRIDDTPVHKAIREALANCLVNADYYGRRGVVIIKRPKLITMANPGTMRIELDTAVSGGVSDPRNSTLLKMFNFIDIGERAGSGIPNIYSVWKAEGWAAPNYKEQMNPDRTVLALPLSPEKASDEKQAIKTGDKKQTISDKAKESIIIYLTNNPEGKTVEIAQYLNLSPSRTRNYLKELVEEGVVIAEGASNKVRTYRLKR